MSKFLKAKPKDYLGTDDESVRARWRISRAWWRAELPKLVDLARRRTSVHGLRLQTTAVRKQFESDYWGSFRSAQRPIQKLRELEQSLQTMEDELGRGGTVPILVPQKRGHPQDVCLRAALLEAQELSRPWQFVAAVLHREKIMRGRFNNIYERVRKAHSSLTAAQKSWLPTG